VVGAGVVAGAGAGALVAPWRRRRAMSPSASFPSDWHELPPPPPPPPRPAPPAPRRRVTRPATESGRLELARLAADYLSTVASGSRRPVVDLAARRSWSVGRTRDMLGRARTQGMLVSAGRGRAGGTLSEEAQRLLAASPDPAPPAAPRLRVVTSGEGENRPQNGPPPEGSAPSASAAPGESRR
jgi:hypothetical protein